MALYKGHLLGGIVTGVSFLFIISSFFSLPITFFRSVELLVCSLAGSLFPDIDIKSKGQKYFYRIIFVLVAIAFYKGNIHVALYCSFFSIIPLIVRHRGIFHTVWFVVVIPSLLFYIVSLYFPVYKSLLIWDALFFIGGAFSHLILDFGFKGLWKFR